VRFSFLILIGRFATLAGMKIKSVTPLHHPMNMGSSANPDPRRRRAFVAVVAALSKGYDLDWKQVDRDPAKDAASYYIQASESGGEPPGRWWGPAAKVAAIDYLLDGRYRMAADGTCQVWRGEGGGNRIH
jgi:hypothetical protein